MAGLEAKNLRTPDELRTFPNGRLEIVNLGAGTVGRGTLQPGWKWSRDVGPLVGKASCPLSHFGYVLSGRLGLRMDDGTEAEAGPGDVVTIPPGHDAWVVGDEPYVVIDWVGSARYALKD